MISLRRLPFKIKRQIYLKWLHPCVKLDKTRLGSPYGSWTVPNNLLNSQSVCYTAGAGEDISFDVALQQQFGCEVHIFDPTPRALAHFNSLKQHITEQRPFKTPTGYEYPSIKPDVFHVQFHYIGLWDKEDTLKFYAPKNEQHVSFSALNLQKTESYFEAKVDSVANIMERLGHNKITLLKMDIEGAEYKVIDSIIEQGIDIDVVCIEFDESHTPLNGQFHKRIAASLQKLKKAGYMVFDIDKTYNYSLISSNAFSKLIAAN